jgi:hypothetical protein
MDEATWLACDDPRPMLEFLRGKASDRKLRLFACACCRRTWQLLEDARSRGAIEVSERFADGLASEREVQEASGKAWEAAQEIGATDPDPLSDRCKVALSASVAAVLPEDQGAWGQMRLALHLTLHPGADEYLAHCELIRDLIGSPFRPAILNPAWLTADVVPLARVAYDSRALPSGELDPARLAVLADALEETGCTNATILSHLRSSGPHVRGCWPIDILLGKS